MTRYLVEAHSESLKESAGDHRLQHVVIGFAHNFEQHNFEHNARENTCTSSIFYKLKIIRF